MAYILPQDQGNAQWTGSRWSWSWRREWRTSAASAAESEVRLPLALAHSALLTVPKEKSLSLSRFSVSSLFHASFHSACCCCLDSCQEQLFSAVLPDPRPKSEGPIWTSEPVWRLLRKWAQSKLRCEPRVDVLLFLSPELPAQTWQVEPFWWTNSALAHSRSDGALLHRYVTLNREFIISFS